MNLKISLFVFVIFSYCFLKLFGLSGLLLFTTSIFICVLTILSVILSSSTDKTVREIIFGEKSNPLDDTRKIIGLKCK